MSEVLNRPTWIYRYYNVDGTLLYIGITNNPRKRHVEHVAGSKWFTQVTKSTSEMLLTRDDALAAERQAIISERPLHNINHNKPQHKSVFIKYRVPNELLLLRLENDFLKRENTLLREQVEREREQADYWRQTATMLLSHQPIAPEQPENRKKEDSPLWRKLFGRGK